MSLRIIGPAILVAVFVAMSASCSQGTEQSGPQASADSTPESPLTVIQLPVTLNEVMAALVNEAADPLWVAAWREPQTDEQWRELKRRAVQLELAATLITYPGTGALDRQWTAKPGWQEWSKAMQAAAADAVTAVENRDMAAIGAVGDSIVETCEGCHTQFKLDFPTAGEFGEISPNEADFDDD